MGVTQEVAALRCMTGRFALGLELRPLRRERVKRTRTSRHRGEGDWVPLMRRAMNDEDALSMRTQST